MRDKRSKPRPAACETCGVPLPEERPRGWDSRQRRDRFCSEECWPGCLTPDCPRPVEKSGLCATCYQRVRRNQDWGTCLKDDCPKRAVGPHGRCNAHNLQHYRTKPCIEPGCPKFAIGRGLCPMHYRRSRGPEWGRRAHLKRNFGLTQDEYDALFDAQGGVCAICHQPEHKVHQTTGQLYNLPVDHNHQTGEVRGLPCSNCNVAIGLLGDDPDRIRALLAYVENPPARLILLRESDLA